MIYHIRIGYGNETYCDGGGLICTMVAHVSIRVRKFDLLCKN